ncbi:MAG: hypothetical protein U0176_16975 [Bacteroidia bacterium]
MQFIDPFQLLQLNVTDPNAADAAMLTEAEGKLADQLSNTDGALTVNGRSLPVADAKTLIGAMQDPNARRHFWEMRSIPGLIPYLEGQPNANPTLLINKCKEKGPEFFEFASRWLADRLNVQMESAITAEKWSEVVILGRATAALESKHESSAVASGTAFFEGLRARIEVASNADVSKLSKESIHFHQLAMLGALNSLPPSQQQLRDEVALALGRLISKVATTEEGKLWTFTLFTDMMKIQTSPAVTPKLRALNKIVKRDSGMAEKGADHCRARRRVEISIAVTVGLFLIRLILWLTNVI